MAKGKDLKARIFAFIAIAKAKLALAQIANLPKPMVYQGTIGQGGTVSSLPADPEVGDTYIVITDGTYGSFTARVGDIFVFSDNDGWTLVPTGDIDTWRNIFVNGTEVMSVTNKDPLKLVAGTNISLAWDSTNKTITINTTGLASVATSGSYNDLTDTPTIPAPQVNSDWNASSGVAQILNKPDVTEFTVLFGTLTAGQTTLTFTDSAITATSLIEVFAEPDIWCTDRQQSIGSVVLTFPVQSVDVAVTVRID